MKTEIVPLLLVPVFSSLTVNVSAESSDKRPNILFCIADDAGHMSAYGCKWVNTPAFDRIADEGLLFNNMFTCNAKSAPSRATIITGRNSWQLEEACNHWAKFPMKFKSYPEALSENGYEVACTGKGWGPGYALDKNGNKRRLTGVVYNDKRLIPPTKEIFNYDYAGNFEEFMQKRDKSKPFCFWYGALEPHRGYEFESSKRFGKKLEDIDEVPPYWPDNETVRRDMLDYAVEVEHYDSHLGKILQILEESGELDNTIIIATSDHNMPFPRCKGQEYYDSNHIPFAIMWKKGIYKTGREINEYISTIDIAPTLLEAAGVDPEKAGMQPVTGRSFMDILKGESKGLDRNFMMIGKERHDVGRPYDQGYPIRGMIRGDFLYIRNFEPERWPAGNPETGYMNVDGSPTKTEVIKARKNKNTEYIWQLSFGKRLGEELYNIKKDPHCMKNLATDDNYSTLKNKMREEMFKRLVEQGDPRVFGNGYIFDNYPDMSEAHNYWERTRDGEKVRTVWINDSDFDPEAGKTE